MTKSLHFANEQWTQRVSITVSIVTYFTVIYLCCVIRILWKYNMYLTAPFRFRWDSTALASLNRNYPFPIVVFYFPGVVCEVIVPVIAVSYISWFIFLLMIASIFVLQLIIIIRSKHMIHKHNIFRVKPWNNDMCYMFTIPFCYCDEKSAVCCLNSLNP